MCGIEAWVPVRPAERWAIAGGEVVAISQHTIDRFRAANPAFASTDVTVCHPGYLRSRTRHVALPTSFECSTGPTALIVARMSAAERYKGHDALLDIWPRLLSRHPDAVLAIAGDGDDRPRLEARVAELGVAHAVRFLGRVDDGRLDELYGQCRFFVMPSRDEGFGLVFLEAMRAGKPCIGGRGAASEIIEHGVTGLIVDPDSRDGSDGGSRAAVQRARHVPAIRRSGPGAIPVDVHQRLLSARFTKAMGRRTLVTLAASMP